MGVASYCDGMEVDISYDMGTPSGLYYASVRLMHGLHRVAHGSSVGTDGVISNGRKGGLEIQRPGPGIGTHIPSHADGTGFYGDVKFVRLLIEHIYRDHACGPV